MTHNESNMEELLNNKELLSDEKLKEVAAGRREPGALTNENFKCMTACKEKGMPLAYCCDLCN